MKYILIKRKRSFCAKDDTEFINWMRRKDMQFWKTNKEFMEEYAHRKRIFEKIILRFDTERNFVSDLLMNNLLKTENEEKSFWSFLIK